MADPFQPKFVDLVRNTTTTTGANDFVLGPAAIGYTGFTAACQVGDSFYYSAISIDKPQEREVGRGTLLAGGIISRDPVSGTKTNFTSGTKSIALIAAAEWYSRIQSGTSAATRAALAATPATQSAVLLSEQRREGLFVWDGSNQSANVTADAAQGIFVAPTSDPTGASGAWVRKYSGPVSVKWFGAVGDGVTNDGAAIVNAIAFLRASATNSNGNYKASQRLFVPAGHYYLGTTTLDISHTLVIEGDSVGFNGVAYASKLRWAAGTTGIRIQRYNTSGVSTVDQTAHSGGDGTILRGLHLYGGYSGTEGEFHGIHAKARFGIEHCKIENFQGDGIYSSVAAGSGGANEGNANCSRIVAVTVTGCRNGIHVDGADTNIWTIIGADTSANRQWGIWDSSFLGNSYFGCHAEANGWITGAPPSQVSYSGNRYCVKFGQDSGASSNAPSGTTADNGWWYYMGVGDANPGLNIPLWTSGTTYRAGGSYCADGSGNANNLFSGCYHEGGQGFAQIALPALVCGGSMRPNVRGVAVLYGGTSINSDGGLSASGNLTAGGNNHTIGPIAGSAADNVVYLDNNNVRSDLIFRHWTGGVPGTDGSLHSVLGVGLSYEATQFHQHYVAGSRIFYVDANGINLDSGKFVNAASLKIAGTTTVDGSRNGSFASISATGTIASSGGGIGYATGAGGSVTQATSKSTGVALNKLCGQITMNAAALAANAAVSFTVTNSQVVATDVIDLVLQSGNAAAGTYNYQIDKVSAGSFVVWVKNISGGSLSEALVFNFSVKKAVNA
jgi:hypothetical protein